MKIFFAFVLMLALTSVSFAQNGDVVSGVKVTYRVIVNQQKMHPFRSGAVLSTGECIAGIVFSKNPLLAAEVGLPVLGVGNLSAYLLMHNNAGTKKDKVGRVIQGISGAFCLGYGLTRPRAQASYSNGPVIGGGTGTGGTGTGTGGSGSILGSGGPGGSGSCISFIGVNISFQNPLCDLTQLIGDGPAAGAAIYLASLFHTAAAVVPVLVVEEIPVVPDVVLPEVPAMMVVPLEMVELEFSAPIPSSRVDNVSKAKLDATVLLMKQSDGTVILEGNSLTGHGDIMLSRATNAKKYLVENGIDPQRITVTRGTKRQRAVEIILAP